jgi:ArsR family transcriptional regulator
MQNNFIFTASQIADLLGEISSPQRIAILLAIGKGEACVCHLEAKLGWRQAYISQHLMSLRRANILMDRRAGRYIYYRLSNASILDLILGAATLSGIQPESLSPMNIDLQPICSCPQCVLDASIKESVMRP